MIQAGTIRIGSGRTCLRRRRVLDQLDQSVAVDDLAGRDGHVAARPGRPPSRPAASLRTIRSQSSRKLRKPCDEVLAARFQGAPLHDRVGGEEIGGRDHVEDLPRDELDDASCCLVTPSMPVVALCHHCCCSRKAW